MKHSSSLATLTLYEATIHTLSLDDDGIGDDDGDDDDNNNNNNNIANIYH